MNNLDATSHMDHGYDDPYAQENAGQFRTDERADDHDSRHSTMQDLKDDTGTVKS